MSDLGQIHLAMHILPLLCITQFIACCAFLLGRRDVFLAGAIGSLFASLIPGPVVYTDYSSDEGAVMGNFSDIYFHSLTYGSLGALGGSVVAVWCVHLVRSRNHHTHSNVTTSHIVA